MEIFPRGHDKLPPLRLIRSEISQSWAEFVLAHALRHQTPMTIQVQVADVGRSAPTERKSGSWFDDLVRRVKAEYLEMPGLRLSAAQAQRLWSLDAKTCMSVLEALLADRFLACTSSGNSRRFDLV